MRRHRHRAVALAGAGALVLAVGAARGAGEVVTPPRAVAQAPEPASAARSTRDVDGDGLDDFVVDTYGEAGPQAVVVFGARDRRRVDPARARGLGITLAGAPEVSAQDPRIVWDVDGDGLADVAVTAGLGDQGFIVFGRVAGGTVVIDTRAPDPGVATEVRGVSGNGEHNGAIEPAGDVDADGFADVLVPGPQGRRLVSVVRGGPRVATVDARGPSPRVVPVEGTRGWANVATGLGDHGGDARDDLAIATLMRGGPAEMGAWIAVGRPGADGYRLVAGRRERTVRAGTRRAGTYVPTCATGRATVGRCPADPDSVGTSFFLRPPLRVGDVDRDGFDDIALVRLDPRRRQVASLVFGGRAAAQRRRTRTLPFDPQQAVGDVDGDGRPDVVGITRSGRTAIFHLGRFGRVGATTALRNRRIDLVEGVGDRDGDGLRDVLFAGQGNAAIVHGAPAHGTVDLRRPGGRVVPVAGLG